MDKPIGSTIINNLANYDFNNYKFLIDVSDNKPVVSSWNRHYFNHIGKPIYNINNINTDPQILIDFYNEFPNWSTTRKSSYYNELLNKNYETDIEIGHTETKIDFTFLDEGAGYKNTIGYYFFFKDTHGNKHLLTSDNSSQFYYEPTIIFPNCSKNNNNNQYLINGDTRQLKGNLPNGKFKNINIGFFIVPNGWNPHFGVKKNNSYVIHSSSEFNRYYHNHYQNIDDYRNGIHTILFSHSNKNKYIICMEDIERPRGDKDFNDVVFQVTTNYEFQNLEKILTLNYNIRKSLCFCYEFCIVNDVVLKDSHGFIKNYDYCYYHQLNSNQLFSNYINFKFKIDSNIDEHRLDMLEILSNDLFFDNGLLSFDTTTINVLNFEQAIRMIYSNEYLNTIHNFSVFQTNHSLLNKVKNTINVQINKNTDGYYEAELMYQQLINHLSLNNLPVLTNQENNGNQFIDLDNRQINELCLYFKLTGDVQLYDESIFSLDDKIIKLSLHK